MSYAMSLGFEGVVTTDDIGMGAVSTLFARPGIAVSALQAGCDLIMMSAHWTDTNRAIELAQDLRGGLRNGTLSPKLFEASQKRIATLLDAATVHPIKSLPAALFIAHCETGARIGEVG